MEKLLNCTPHDVTLIKPFGVITLQPTGICPRVQEDHLVISEVDGIPIVETLVGEVYGLPDFQEDTLLIVSRAVAEAALGRSDLVYPSQLVRDDKGVVIGASRLTAAKGLAERIDLLASIEARHELWEDMQDDQGPLK